MAESSESGKQRDGPRLSRRLLNRYNAWAAIRKRAEAAGFLTPVGCHT